MKYLVLLLLIGFHLTAQNKIWIDRNGNTTNKENATYYRTSKKIKNKYWVTDFTLNGNIYREGLSKSTQPKKEQFEGLVVVFYPNGNPKHKYHYKKGLLQGTYRKFFKTGELQELCKYKKGKLDGVWKEFNKLGKIKTKGRYKNGEKVGVWKTYYKNTYENLVD